MPHIIADRLDPIEPLPVEIEGYKFLFASEGDNGIIGVQSPNAVFLLRKKRRGGEFILKADKATRPPFLNEIKRSMSLFAKICGGKITAKNYNDKVIENGAIADNFYDADYFARNYDFSKPLWIEIGFGSGRHILKNAAETRDRTHLGLEIHRPSAEQLLCRAKRENIDNIAVALADARSFISALPPNSCERIFIHFPVPWDKSEDRRVFSREFLKHSIDSLINGGKIELRTDSADYFKNSLEIARKFDNINIETKQNTEAIISSKYEDRWRKMNRDIFDLIITKKYGGAERKTAMDFTFSRADLNNLREKLLGDREFLIISESFLLKKTDIWHLGGEEYMARILCGGKANPETLYILLGDRAEYFARKPLATEENFAAHKALCA